MTTLLGQNLLKQEDYIYSSAAYYSGLPSLIDIDIWDGVIQYK